MKRQNTRERILDTCRKLFNSRGPVAVTTAVIADAAGINEGNLYYYFKKKADIVNALFDRFAEEQLELASHDRDLRVWFELMWDWRFFYRDSSALYAMDPSLRSRLRETSDIVQGHGRDHLRELVARGHLQASEEEIERLVENAWIISTYWIDYLHSRHGITRVTRKHIDWGYQQMEALFEPYRVSSSRLHEAATNNGA